VCENYINTLVNSPKEFDDVVVELKFQLKEITGKDWELINENPNTEFVASSTAGAGVMAGAGVAVLGQQLLWHLQPPLAQHQQVWQYPLFQALRLLMLL
jgi:hypothetical protein